MARTEKGNRGPARRTRAPADDPAADALEVRQARELPTRRGPEGDEARGVLARQAAQGAGASRTRMVREDDLLNLLDVVRDLKQYALTMLDAAGEDDGEGALIERANEAMGRVTAGPWEVS